MKKKFLCVITAMTILLSGASASVACAADNGSSESLCNEVISVDLAKLSIDTEAVSDWNEGLINALKVECADDNLTVDDLKGDCTRFDKVLYEYGQNNCDEISAAINNHLIEEANSENVTLDLNVDSPIYKQYTKTYTVDENTDVTITPEAIYIDEFVEEDVVNPNSDIRTVATTNATWKYKNVATRRTYFYKVTVKGKTYSFDIYSTHTGGQVKYNGSTAKHSADYYGYSMRKTFGELATFTKIAKLSEQYSGTSWHYKFTGKVSGKISITSPISLKVSLPDKLLGCQVITSKSGEVTKKHWPSLD